jgi:hypothetical protein
VLEKEITLEGYYQADIEKDGEPSLRGRHIALAEVVSFGVLAQSALR